MSSKRTFLFLNRTFCGVFSLFAARIRCRTKRLHPSSARVKSFDLSFLFNLINSTSNRLTRLKKENNELRQQLSSNRSKNSKDQQQQQIELLREMIRSSENALNKEKEKRTNQKSDEYRALTEQVNLTFLFLVSIKDKFDLTFRSNVWNHRKDSWNAKWELWPMKSPCSSESKSMNRVYEKKVFFCSFFQQTSSSNNISIIVERTNNSAQGVLSVSFPKTVLSFVKRLFLHSQLER